MKKTYNPKIKKPIHNQRVIITKNNKKNKIFKKEDINNLIIMKFIKEKTIRINNGNFNNALDYLFNNLDEVNEEIKENNKREKMMKYSNKRNKCWNRSIYNLFGYITLLIKNTDHNHFA